MGQSFAISTKEKWSEKAEEYFVCGYTSSVFFCFFVKTNQRRVASNKKAIPSGKIYEGWWSSDEFINQVESRMDCIVVSHSYYIVFNFIKMPP